MYQQDEAELMYFSPTINVTKPTGLALLSMMQSSCPVHCDITFTAVETRGTLHATPCTDTAELKEAIKDWTVVSHIETTLLLLIRLHIVGGYFIQEVNVLIGMELRHFKLGSGLRTLLVVSQQRSSTSITYEGSFRHGRCQASSVFKRHIWIAGSADEAWNGSNRYGTMVNDLRRFPSSCIIRNS